MAWLFLKFLAEIRSEGRERPVSAEFFPLSLPDYEHTHTESTYFPTEKFFENKSS